MDFCSVRTMTPRWSPEIASWAMLPLQPQAIINLLVWPTEYQIAQLWMGALVCALSWVGYRLYEIYHKPLSELVEILGLDIPPIPDVFLAGVTADSVLLYWKPPENYQAPLRHFIQVNGILAGEFNRSDASVQVTGLDPGTFYNIRAVAQNTAKFSSLGPLISLRTRALTSHEQNKLPGISSVKDDEGRTTATSDETSTHGPLSYTSRDHSSSQGNRRTISGCRSSPVYHCTDHMNGTLSQTNGHEDSGSEETIPQLTRKLDALRQQQEETNQQIEEEEEDAERSKATFMKERDDLKQVLKEKEETQLEFKRQVNELEKQSKAAQRKKSAKERLLFQKQAEKQKMKDDVEKWKREIDDMRSDGQDMLAQKASLSDAKQKKFLEIRKSVDDCQAANKTMEEDIRVMGIQIKALEKGRRPSDGGQNGEEEESERLEREREQAHEARWQECQIQYAALWQTLQDVEVEFQQAQDRLSLWAGRRARDPNQFAPVPNFDFSTSTLGIQRRSRQGASRASTISHSSSNYPTGSGTYTSISPTFSTTSPFITMNNGMKFPIPTEWSGMSQADADNLTGGAPMSPTANTLLPSNLLRDDDQTGNHVHGNIGLDSGRGLSSQGHIYIGQISPEPNFHGPHSPVSEKSQSPSLLSSPHDSIYNSQGFYSVTDPFGESDGRSVHSTNSPYTATVTPDTNPIAARRLGGLFNFNRQRGKSSAQEPPLLGTLKQGQSQSFPRNLDQGLIDLISPSGRRRVSSGTWANPMASLLAKSNATATISTKGDERPTVRSSFGRRGRLNMFGAKLEPGNPSASFDRSSSPRPSSTYSFENTLPRPSTESQPFGWSIGDGVRQRSSPLGVDWSTLGGPWSRNNSRRPSVQHGSSSNLSLGSTPLDPEDWPPGIGKQGVVPAPIGTERFQILQRPITPKLNPTAPSFTTRLFSRNEARKASKNDRINEKITEKSSNKDTENLTGDLLEHGVDESSPPSSRLSRDTRSIMTATSVADSHDSLEPATSATPSDTIASSAPKETLMQRITRKGSSSKFNVPWGKDKGGLFSKKTGEPSTPGEVDEDTTSDAPLGRSVDSVSSTPQHEKGNRGSISWSSIIRKSKKGDKAPSESSERTEETETGDEDY